MLHVGCDRFPSASDLSPNANARRCSLSPFKRPSSNARAHATTTPQARTQRAPTRASDPTDSQWRLEVCQHAGPWGKGQHTKCWAHRPGRLGRQHSADALMLSAGDIPTPRATSRRRCRLRGLPEWPRGRDPYRTAATTGYPARALFDQLRRVSGLQALAILRITAATGRCSTTP